MSKVAVIVGAHACTLAPGYTTIEQHKQIIITILKILLFSELYTLLFVTLVVQMSATSM